MASALTSSTRRLSISNIAWPADADDDALDLVAALGFQGVELAPGKVFGDLATVSAETMRDYRRRVEARGLAICALQAILFGVPDVHLFESAGSRERMADHLRRVAGIAGALGAGACVFGSPTLRDPGELSTEDACSVAEAFLRRIAPDFATHGVSLCFEANPARYGCRFVTRTEEAFRLVDRVDTPGIRMQLDTGTIFINGEDPGIIPLVEGRIGHFHVSEPDLVPIGVAGVDHHAIAEALSRSTYPHWLSIEMKAGADWRSSVRHARELVGSAYAPREPA